MTDTGPFVGQFVDVQSKDAADIELWSVTSILNVLDKPALVPWAAIETAKAAVRDESAWRSRLEHEGEQSAVDYLKQARFRRPPGQRSATDLGSVVHAACETYALSGRRPEVDDEVAPFVRQFERFLEEFQPEYQAVEMTVYNETYGYAGTLDGIFKIDGQSLIFDYKTSREAWDSQGRPKGPYPEVSLQLSAYRYADFAACWQARRFERMRRRYYLLNATERALSVSLPAVDDAVAVYLTPHTYAVHPVNAEPEDFDAFLYVCEVARWTFGRSKSAVAAPMIPPHPLPAESESDPFEGLPR